MTARPRALRIGCGAGYAGDRIEPAVELAERGELDVLVFECLAERTMALAQQARRRDAAGGYDGRLVERMEAVMPACLDRGTRVISNMGAANPDAAAATAADLARDRGWRGVTVAAVTGDDVLETVLEDGHVLIETGEPVSALGTRLVSANAYLGAAPVVDALARGATVVLTGRVADPALFLAAQVHAFDWPLDEWSILGRGVLVGHLLECAGQVTGGYFADAGHPVDGLSRLGFPLAEVLPDGSAIVTKVDGSGGVVNAATCKAQLLYEVHDPAAYLTPDVTADFSGVRIEDVGPHRVAVSGAGGRARPERLKVAVGYQDGFAGEGQISYAGPGALGRARLALDIVMDRLRLTGARPDEVRGDLIGVDALHAKASRTVEPYEVRVRVAARTRTRRDAERIGEEVEALYTNGPAAGGGAVKSVREVLAIGTTFVARDRVRARVHLRHVP